MLFTHSENPYHIKKSDRIAQLILKKINIVEVKELSSINRSEKGFGFTRKIRELEETKVITEGDLKQLVWREHLKGDWGSKTIYCALQKNRTPVKNGNSKRDM